MDRSWLIPDFIASKIVNREGSGILLDIVLGVIGALVGGSVESAGANQAEETAQPVLQGQIADL